MIATPIYKVEARLLQPLAKDVQGINVQGINAKGYGPNFVYELIVDNLRSLSMRRKYFDKHKIFEHFASDYSVDLNINKVFEEEFNKNLKVHQDPKNPRLVSVSFEDRDAKLAAEWTNGFITFVERHTVNDLVSDVSGQISIAKRALQKQIVSKRNIAKLRRMDTVNQLEEALLIAESLGIRESKLYKVSPAENNSVSISTSAQPLYMKGVKALSAEIKVLQQRKGDDPFIQGLRDLQEKLSVLNSVVIEKELIKAARVDQEARVPDQPLKPKKILIMILAGILGLIMGVCVAFIRNIARQNVEVR